MMVELEVVGTRFAAHHVLVVPSYGRETSSLYSLEKRIHEKAGLGIGSLNLMVDDGVMCSRCGTVHAIQTQCRTQQQLLVLHSVHGQCTA